MNTLPTPTLRSRALHRLACAVLLALALGALLPVRSARAQVAAPAPATAPTEATTPARAAETLRHQLLQVQLLATADPAAAEAALHAAQAAYGGNLAPQLAAAAPAADARIVAAFTATGQALTANDPAALATARKAAWTALLDGALQVVEHALEANDPVSLATARSWLLVREFRTPTRFSRPNADATLALAQLAAGQLDPTAALRAVHADLLDTYQARLTAALGDLRQADANGFAVRRAEAAALAAGYFAILAPAYAERQGQPAAAQATAAFTALVEAARTSEPVAQPLYAVETLLHGFRAAPLSPAEQARRAGQLLRFVNLVPVEYGRGVRNGTVTLDLEIREAITFLDGAQAAFADIAPDLERSQPTLARQASDLFAALDAQLAAAGAHTGVADPAAIQAYAEQLTGVLQQLLPPEWRKSDPAADFDVIAAALDQVEQAIAAGDYTLAESARLDAYAILESGPEARLVAFAPQFITPLEDLFWYGQGDDPGLAGLIQRKADLATVTATRQALDAQLVAAQQAIGGSAAPTAIAANAAIIVFREGLEAVVILAALMASMVGARRLHRRPMVLGVLLAFFASGVTYWLMQTVLSSFRAYGERLEAVVSLVAIGVLLLITNWFFHRVYWTDWMADLHGRKKAIMGSVAAGQFLGFLTLGFTSVYREGFETVLFLQALVLEAGHWTVLEGVVLGMVGVLGVGLITFGFQSRLPYKKMLVVTGVLIGAVLLVMVGNTVHVMQVVGWLPIHPIAGLSLPYWSGLWFGLYPTWEGIGLQFAAAAFVIGSYILAEHQARPVRPSKPAAQPALHPAAAD